MATVTPTRPVEVVTEVGDPTETAPITAPIEGPYHHIATILRQAQGRYKQISGMLAADGGYCAMGVLAHEVGVPDSVLRECAQVTADLDIDPYDVLDRLDMPYRLSCAIMEMNDGNGAFTGEPWSFGRIADFLDAIDEEWED